MSPGAKAIRILDAPKPEELGPTPEAFLEILAGPAWIRIPGQDRSRTRVVSTLLHGNEPSGLFGVHGWLRAGITPAVNAVFFIGAVEAALAPPGFQHRALPESRDLNRCFLPPYAEREGQLAKQALELLRATGPEALIDIHNNTGHNPPYGVGPRAGPAELNLIALFGERFVHTGIRLGALVEATQAAFPSVVVECGRVGDPAADAIARGGLDRFLALERLETAAIELPSMELLVDPIRVCVVPGMSLAFGDGPVAGVDLTVAEGIDRHNFENVPPGAAIGWIERPDVWPLRATGADGRDASRELFTIRNGVLETLRGFIPIMMTTNPGIAASDCLFYAVRPQSVSV